MDLANFGLPSLMERLSSEDLAELQAMSRRTRFEDGQVIHSRGDPKPRLGLVIEGTVSIVRRRSDGRMVTVAGWGPGQHFGMESTLFGTVRTHDALAVGVTVVDHIGKAALEALLAQRPSILRALFDITCRRHMLLTECYDDVRLQPPLLRLAKLLMLSRQTSQRRDRIDCTQEDLAQCLSVSTVTVGQLLRRLVSDGLIETSYRTIHFVDPDALAQWIAEREGD